MNAESDHLLKYSAALPDSPWSKMLTYLVKACGAEHIAGNERMSRCTTLHCKF